MLTLLRRAVLLDLENQFKRKIDHEQLFSCLGLILLFNIFLKLQLNKFFFYDFTETSFDIKLNVHKYFKLSITRPGRSRLLEFEKNSTGCLIDIFF